MVHNKMVMESREYIVLGLQLVHNKQFTLLGDDLKHHDNAVAMLMVET